MIRLKSLFLAAASLMIVGQPLHSEDGQVTLYSGSFMNGSIGKMEGYQVRYAVSNDQMLSVPTWSPELEPPPLDFKPALKLAKDWLKSCGETNFTLQSYSVQSGNSHWYYIFSFSPMAGGNRLNCSTAVVLMNGNVVVPLRIPVVQTQSPSR